MISQVKAVDMTVLNLMQKQIILQCTRTI